MKELTDDDLARQGRHGSPLRDAGIESDAPTAQQGKQEPKPAYSREWLRGREHALAALRAEVEGLRDVNYGSSPTYLQKDDVLALIDKMGEKV